VAAASGDRELLPTLRATHDETDGELQRATAAAAAALDREPHREATL
jgi:hypothetical protein